MAVLPELSLLSVRQYCLIHLKLIWMSFPHSNVISPSWIHSSVILMSLSFHHSYVIASFQAHSELIISFSCQSFTQNSFGYHSIIEISFQSFLCHSIVPNSFWFHFVILMSFYHSELILVSFLVIQWEKSCSLKILRSKLILSGNDLRMRYFSFWSHSLMEWAGNEISPHPIGMTGMALEWLDWTRNDGMRRSPKRSFQFPSLSFLPHPVILASFENTKTMGKPLEWGWTETRLRA